jgi:hypothetical protein
VDDDGGQAMSEHEQAEARARLARSYEHVFFRRARLRAYGNKLRALEMMVDAFERKYGPAGSYVIAMGDWSRGQQHARDGQPHLRGMVPTMTMGVIDAFRKRGHVVGFIDESYTSQRCSRPGCCGRCDDEWLRVPARPPLRPRARVVRGLVRCTLCSVVHDRDWNASRNIYNRALEWRERGPPADDEDDDGSVPPPQPPRPPPRPRRPRSFEEEEEALAQEEEAEHRRVIANDSDGCVARGLLRALSLPRAPPLPPTNECPPASELCSRVSRCCLELTANCACRPRLVACARA